MKLSLISKTSKKYFRITVIVVAAIVVILSAWYLLSRFLNPAYYAAKPLEAALIKAGAERLCNKADSGLGFDNNEPWYDAFYKTNQSHEEIIASIEESARSTGAISQERKTNPKTKQKYINIRYDDNTAVAINVYEGYSFATNEGFCGVEKTGKQGPILVRLTLGMKARRF